MKQLLHCNIDLNQSEVQPPCAQFECDKITISATCRNVAQVCVFFNAGRMVADPIAIIERAHAEHAAICDVLEEIADSLPEAVNSDQCAGVLVFLRQELPQHHKDEEDGLFALLRKKSRKDKTLMGHLEQLSWEHSADESTADEIAESLEKLANGEKAENPNMLGYMLRSFFEGYRRHLHWENTFLLPLARERLSSEDLEIIGSAMTANQYSVGTDDAARDGNSHSRKPENIS